MGARAARASQRASDAECWKHAGGASSHLESEEREITCLSCRRFVHLSRAEVSVAAASRRSVEGVATPAIPQLAGGVAVSRRDVARHGRLGPAGPVADPAIPRR